MSISRFPMLLLTLLLTACAQQPSAPPVTAVELESALTAVESRLIARMNQHAEQAAVRGSDEQVRLYEEFAQLQHRLREEAPAPARQAATVERAERSTRETRDGKLIVGASEEVWLETVDRVFLARVDTGATTSSLSAQDITVFERDGDKWVRFMLAHDSVEETLEVESPLVRYVRIKQASTSKPERRPVVALTLRLGPLTEKAEFTLTDRSEMEFPVLLGREFLQDIVVVDIARDRIQGSPARRNGGKAR